MKVLIARILLYLGHWARLLVAVEGRTDMGEAARLTLRLPRLILAQVLFALAPTLAITLRGAVAVRYSARPVNFAAQLRCPRLPLSHRSCFQVPSLNPVSWRLSAAILLSHLFRLSRNLVSGIVYPERQSRSNAA